MAMFTFLTNMKYGINRASGILIMSSAQQKHSKSQTHVPCYLQLKLFGKQQKFDLHLDTQRTNDVTKHNEQVKKNGIILYRFIVAKKFSSGAMMSILRL